jgi:hypothetical protein
MVATSADLNTVPSRIPNNSALSIHTEIIQPGTDIAIPIAITATRSGEIDLLGMVMASNAENEDDVAVATFTRKWNVQPVASCSTSVGPAKGSEGYYVSVEVSLQCGMYEGGAYGSEITNIAASPITLEELTPVSRYWKTEHTFP